MIILWARLWHDMPSDPKWRVVAKKSGRTIPEIISVFVVMVTNASANATERGVLSNWSDEDVAAMLDMRTEDVSAIRDGMQGKVLDGDVLIGWKKRQPKREDNSAERAKQWRERKRTQTNANERLDKEEEEEEDSEKERNIHQPSESVAARAEQDSAGRQALKSVLNGTTDGMIADVRGWMGLSATDANAIKWLTGTIAAFGHERTARAYSIIVAKLGAGEIVPHPLALWSRTAQGLRSDRPPKAADNSQKPTLAGAFERLKQQRSTEGTNSRVAS